MDRIVNSRTLWVGPEKEIELRGFNYDTDSELEIDEDLGPFSNEVTNKYSDLEDTLSEFWNRTETACVVGCCGIDAFDIEPEQIVKAIKGLDVKMLA